jgi:hypothetical protein
MKNHSKNKTATATEPSWEALSLLHRMQAHYQAQRYADDQSLHTYIAPTLCAPDGRMLSLEVISHPELFRRYPELRLVEAMARYTKDLLKVGHPALRQFVKRHGFAPNVVMHVFEVTARPLVALERLPAALRAQLSTDMVMTSYHTRTRSIAVAHPLVQVDETGRLAMEPQPFPAEGTETVLGGRLAIHA